MKTCVSCQAGTEEAGGGVGVQNEFSALTSRCKSGYESDNWFGEVSNSSSPITGYFEVYWTYGK